MKQRQTIEELLAEVGLPEGLVPITDEKPAFYDPSWQDGRFAYYLVAEGVKPESLWDKIESRFEAANAHQRVSSTAGPRSLRFT